MSVSSCPKGSIGLLDSLPSAANLLGDVDGASDASGLRSGIYAFHCQQGSAPALLSATHLYIIYWPEPTTWLDTANERTQRNRINFMRYLTKLTDQLRALISPEQEARLEWKGANVEEAEAGPESKDSFAFQLLPPAASVGRALDDRVFKFEVTKTKDQEEDAKLGPGFVVGLFHYISAAFSNGGFFVGRQFGHRRGGQTIDHRDPSTTLRDCDRWKWFRVPELHGIRGGRHKTSRSAGPSADGHAPASVSADNVLRPCTSVQWLTLHCVYRHQYPAMILADSITEEGLRILLEDCALKERCPDIWDDYLRGLAPLQARAKEEEASIKTRLRDEFEDNIAMFELGLSVMLAEKLIQAYR